MIFVDVSQRHPLRGKDNESTSKYLLPPDDYVRRSVEVAPNMNGAVRIGQFVDSFSVPRVTVRMEGMDRPLEILCGKILHKKLEKMDTSALKGAKVRDSMGNEAGRWVPLSCKGVRMVPSGDGIPAPVPISFLRESMEDRGC